MRSGALRRGLRSRILRRNVPALLVREGGIVFDIDNAEDHLSLGRKAPILCAVPGLTGWQIYDDGSLTPSLGAGVYNLGDPYKTSWTKARSRLYDGVTDYDKLSSGAPEAYLNPPDAFMIEILFISNANALHSILDKGLGSGNGYGVFNQSSGKLRFQMDDGVDEGRIDSPNIDNGDGNWHLVRVYGHTTVSMYIKVDDNAVASDLTDIPIFANVTGANRYATLGARFGPVWILDGNIALYNFYDLTAELTADPTYFTKTPFINNYLNGFYNRLDKYGVTP